MSSPPESLTATSVTVSWEQPQGSFIPVEYTVVVERVTGSGQTLCPDVEDSKDPVQISTAASLTFPELEEFSMYSVELAARFNEFGSSHTLCSTETFMTLSAGIIQC